MVASADSDQSTKDGTEVVTLDEVKKHTSRDSVWFVIHNKVYDVSKFMDEHPGGEEVLLEQAGKDASEIFEDVSHSADAKDMMKKYLVGELPENERSKLQVKEVKKLDQKHFDDSEHSLSITWTQWVVAGTVSVAVGLIVRSYLN